VKYKNLLIKDPKNHKNTLSLEKQYENNLFSYSLQKHFQVFEMKPLFVRIILRLTQ